MDSKCGAAPDPKIWKEYFTDFRCERQPHAEDVPHFTSQCGGHFWWRGTMAVEEGMVLERIEEAARRHNTPEAKLERAMRGEW